MKSQSVSALLTCSFIALLGMGVASAKDKPVKLADLPKAVQQTAQEQSKEGTVVGYAKEIEKGKTEYEVQLLVNGKTRDVAIDPSGKILETEQEVDLESIPDKAKDAIKKRAGSGKIEKVEEVKSGDSIRYEAHVRSGAKRHEILVNEAGEPAKED